MPCTPTPWRRRLAAAAALVHLLQLLLAGPALAQASGSPQAPSGQRPLVDAARNGVPVIHIAPPNPAGISRNGYERFNVPRQGMVLNNSPQPTRTELAGWIGGNLQLGRVPARIILNEVLGREPSQLLGVLEVAGQRADVVIANPNGITCDGCGFLNTAGRATLLGGRTQLDAQGGLAGLEALASVRIGPRGLDAANQQQLDLVARGLVIEGAVWAQDLRAIVGANRVLYADLRGPLQQLPAGPGAGGFAVDIRELGGMYAQQIYLVANERGLGVNSSGRLVALQGHLELSSAGDLRVREAHAQQDLKLSAQGRLDAGGSLRAGGDLVLAGGSVQGQGGTLEAEGRIAIRAASIALDQQRLNAAGRIDIDAGGDLALTGGTLSSRESLHITSGGAADLSGSRAWAFDAIALDAAGQLVTDRAQLAAPRLQLHAGGAFSNRGGQLLARSVQEGHEADDAALEVQAASIDNAGGQLLSQEKLSLTASHGSLDNSDGTIAAARTQLLGIEHITNRGGTLYVDNDLHLRALDNAGGLLDSTASLSVEAPGQTVDNRGGVLRANGRLDVHAGRIDNHGGSVGATGRLDVSAQEIDNRAGSLLGLEGASVHAAGTVDNRQGLLASATSLALQAQALDNREGTVFAGTLLGLHTEGDYTHTGTLSAGGDLDLSTTGRYTNAGTLSAQGALHLAARELTNEAQAQILGREVDIEVTGEVANAGLVNATDGTTRIRAASLVNTGRIYGNSVVLQADVRNLPNPRGEGAVIAAREGLLKLDGSLRNEGGSLVLGLGDMDFGGEVTNTGATINAGGSIRFAQRLNNLNAGVELATSATIEQIAGTSITKSETTESYAVADLGWRDGAGGRWVLPSQRYPLAVFGSQPMPAAVDFECARQDDSNDCNPTGRYPADDPAWQRFGVAPPPPPPTLPPGKTSCDADNSGESTQSPRDTTGACGAYWTAVDHNNYELMLAHQRLQAALEPFNADLEQRSFVDWFEFQAAERRVQTTVVTGSQPAQVLAGHNIELHGGLNHDSLITAGGQVVGAAVENRATQGEQRSTDYGRVRFSHLDYHGGALWDWYERLYTDWQPSSGGTQVTTFALDTLTPLGNAPVTGPAPQPNTPAPPATPAQLVALLAKALPPAPAQGHPSATRAAPLKGAGYVTVAYDGRIVAPAHQLFGRSAPQAGYLVETDPAFTGWREFISSAAMLAALAMDPERNLKRYGDGFAEQRLIDEQVIALTGQRYLAGYESTEAEYAALIASGVAFAQAYQLTPGVALTAQQMALLTTDIVWLERKSVVLPDGSDMEALVPRVYLRRPAEGDLRPDGALIAASDIYLRQPDGEIRNSGTLLAHGAGNEDGRGALVLEAQDIANSGALQGNAVFVDAQRDLLLDGGTVTGLGRDSVARLHASRDVIVRTTTQTRDDELAGPNGTTQASRTSVDRIATVQADSVAMLAEGDIALAGARVFATGALAMKAQGDIRLDTVQEAYAIDAPLGGEALGRSGYYRAGSQTNVGSQVSAGGNAILDAGGDFTARGAALHADGDLSISGQSVLITGAIDQHSIDQQGVDPHGYSRAAANGQDLLRAMVDAGGHLGITSQQDLIALGASLSADGNVSLEAARHLTLGTLALTEERQTEYRNESHHAFSSSSNQGQTNKRSTYAAGSTVSGDNVTFKAGTGAQGPGHVLMEGSQVAAQHDLKADATGDVTVRAALNTYSASASNSHHASGAGAMGGVSWGSFQQQDSSSDFQQSASASSMGSLEGDIRVTAGGTYRQQGSDLVSLQGGIDVDAQRIEVTEAREAARSERHSQTRQSGLTLTVGSPLLGAAQAAGRMADAAGNTEDARLQALAAATTALAALNAVDAVQANPGQLGGADLNLSLVSSKSSSDSRHGSDSAAASSLYAKGRIHLKATGAGSESDIVLQGAQLQAGRDVSLGAEDEVLMRAARNTSEDHSQNKSSGASVGVSYGGGKDGFGFAITGSAQAARGHADGNDVTWTNTRIDVGGTFTLKSGGDTHMQGATVNANRIATHIAGDLLIDSPQDTSSYDSRQRNAGVNGSLGLGTRGSSGSVGVGGSNIHSTYASVNEQSGLFAGDGGFEVDVHGTTTLVGGAITTTDQAVAEGRNQFKTERLVLQDIENKADYQASAYAVSLGTGQNNDGSRNVQGTSAGFGQASGSASSVTRAGISGVAGNADARTGDAPTGIAWIFDADKTQREVDAQVAITQQASAEAPKAIARYADRQKADLVDQASKESDPARKAELEREAKKWDEGGAYRVALHTAAGAMAGGVAGAAGAAASQWAIEPIGDALKNSDLPVEVKQTLALAAGTAIGAAAGGTAGAAIGLGATANNYLSSTDLRNREQHLADARKKGDVEEELRILREYEAQSAKNTGDILYSSVLTKETLAAEKRALEQLVQDPTVSAETKAQAARSINELSTAINVIEKAPLLRNAEELGLQAIDLVFLGELAVAKVLTSAVVKELIVSRTGKVISDDAATAIANNFYRDGAQFSSNFLDGRPLANLRLQYEAAARDVRIGAQEMLSSGASEEEVARWAMDRRNQLKAEFKGATPSDVLTNIEERNVVKYGNSNGPTVDQLREQGKSWKDIIESASRPGGADLDLSPPGFRTGGVK